MVVQLGVRGIRLKADDELLTMQVADENADLLTVTEGGFAKRTQLMSIGDKIVPVPA